MNKLRIFHKTLVRSWTQFNYYKEILKAPFSFSLKYLAFLIFVTTAIQIITLSFNAALLLPKLPVGLSNISRYLDNAYPEDLVVTMKKGVVSVNQPTPYTIDFPEFTSEVGVEHGITFDPDARVDDFNALSTMVLVTDREFVYGDYSSASKGQYRVFPISPEREDGTLDRGQYDLFLSQVNEVFDQIVRFAPLMLVVFAVVTPFIVAAFSIMWMMVYLIVMTAILYIVMKSFKQSILFWKLYQMGMHGLSVPILATFIMTLLGFSFPFVFTSIFLLWMVIVLSKMEVRG
ncbi:DUF1189 family protein [Candidatus Woesebacteria bacterium]|nr:DUF1189 family protein [Candidatus Woesebacteria bacterium]